MAAQRIGIVGAGMMGTEIAFVLASGGHDVILADQSVEKVATSLQSLKALVEKQAARGLRDLPAAQAALERISAGEIAQFTDRDFVIEAIFENHEAKAEIYTKLDAVLPQEAIIASNTSSLSITALSGSLPEARRARFLGTHFFSPVTRMKLVEVISGLDSDAAVVDQVYDLLAATGQEPVRVKDVVGFAVNRALHAFFIEAIRLVQEGAISVEDMDRACKLGLGHPVGPFELMDVTKNDLGLQVQDILKENYGERFRAPSLLRSMVAAGYNGRAAGRGWYRYENGRRVTAKKS